MTHFFRSLTLLLGIIATPLLAADRPNIVLIFADDLGWKDVGYQGSDYHETPNIDRLAKQGMVFTNAYASAGNCAPSRACLLSGQYTPRHGVYAVGSTKRGPVELMRMEPIPNKTYLDPENVTVAEALKAAGYVTGCFGKWHLGGRRDHPNTAPGDQGFDVVMDQNYPGSGEQADPKGIYTITAAACEFIEKNKDRPFFAYIPHHAIHTGLQARPATLEKFKNKKPGEQHKDPLYAACLYDLDDGIGMVIKKLADLGLADNTLVVFTSDNGGTQKSSQEPLRGSKGGYYEGGIREPFIVRWPGVVKAGSRCDVPVINVDLYPTFLAAAAGQIPAGKVLDGESLLPLFKQSGDLARKAIFWHFPGYLDNPVIRGRDPVFRTRPVSVIRKGDWKLHLYHEEWQLDAPASGRGKADTPHAIELYNIAQDIGEHHNVAAQHEAERDELLADLLVWMKRTEAKTPTEPNPQYGQKPTNQPQQKQEGKKKRKKQG